MCCRKNRNFNTSRTILFCLRLFSVILSMTKLSSLTSEIIFKYTMQYFIQIVILVTLKHGQKRLRYLRTFFFIHILSHMQVFHTLIARTIFWCKVSVTNAVSERRGKKVNSKIKHKKMGVLFETFWSVIFTISEYFTILFSLRQNRSCTQKKENNK